MERRCVGLGRFGSVNQWYGNYQQRCGLDENTSFVSRYHIMLMNANFAACDVGWYIHSVVPPITTRFLT